MFFFATSALFAAACFLPFSLIPNEPAFNLSPDGVAAGFSTGFACASGLALPLFAALFALKSAKRSFALAFIDALFSSLTCWIVLPEAILFAAIICALVLGLPCFVLSETTGSDAVADFTGSAFSLLLKGAGSIFLIGLLPFLSATYLSTCFDIFSPFALSAAALIFLRFARSAPPASAAPAASLPAGPNFDNTFAPLTANPLFPAAAPILDTAPPALNGAAPVLTAVFATFPILLPTLDSADLNFPTAPAGFPWIAFEDTFVVFAAGLRISEIILSAFCVLIFCLCLPVICSDKDSSSSAITSSIKASKFSSIKAASSSVNSSLAKASFMISSSDWYTLFWYNFIISWYSFNSLNIFQISIFRYIYI